MRDFVSKFVDDLESWSGEKFQSHVKAKINLLINSLPLSLPLPLSLSLPPSLSPLFLKVDALIDMKEEDDDCLDDEVDRNWSEILTQSYQFDRLEKHVKILQTISKTKACRWLKRYLQSGGENYRKLSVKVLLHMYMNECMFMHYG